VRNADRMPTCRSDIDHDSGVVKVRLIETLKRRSERAPQALV
jgi:hypothetical protein